MLADPELTGNQPCYSPLANTDGTTKSKRSADLNLRSGTLTRGQNRAINPTRTARGDPGEMLLLLSALR